ncbi:DUF397 domain-containing protein [Streptomyces sp. NPDC101221]|uniref:DUF397 domain-containing protein n=1 Tax=Streptomyces sp. NPDC101221 TaxID=3366132 RepID=UPI003817E953
MCLVRTASRTATHSGRSKETAGPVREIRGGGSSGNGCLEAAPTPATTHVRDSKDTSGPRLALTPEAWRTSRPTRRGADGGSRLSSNCRAL